MFCVLWMAGDITDKAPTMPLRLLTPPDLMRFARNGLSEQVSVYPLGLGASNALGIMRLSDLRAGAALHGERMVEPGAQAHSAGVIQRNLDSLLIDNQELEMFVRFLGQRQPSVAEHNAHVSRRLLQVGEVV